MEIIGNSPSISEAIRVAIEIAKTDITVLITGESGTGKEVFSKYIHTHSKRNKKPFIAINCGAIAQSILESELFGHEKGAFTGAIATRRGYFESANEGTIFLDEIGDMPLDTQVKVLRIIESGEFQRVGSSEMLKTNVRIIAATNRSLETAVSKKTFRHDLYFRLRVASIHLPPLRERREDILMLAENFVRELEEKYQVKFHGFSSEATKKLLEYPFPGNIRELKNLLEALVALEHSEIITPERLKKYLQTGSVYSPSLIELPHASQGNSVNEQNLQYLYNLIEQLQHDISDIKKMLLVKSSSFLLPSETNSVHASSNQANGYVSNTQKLNEIEKQTILETIKSTNGSKRKAAKILGITERTLYRKIKSYNIKSYNNQE